MSEQPSVPHDAGFPLFKAALDALIADVETLRKEVGDGMYCGCDGECFAACPRSWNGALDAALEKMRGKSAEVATRPLNRHGQPRPEGWYPGYWKDRRAWEAEHPGEPFVGKGKL